MNESRYSYRCLTYFEFPIVRCEFEVRDIRTREELDEIVRVHRAVVHQDSDR